MNHELPLSDRDISLLEDSLYFMNRSIEALNMQMHRLENYTFKQPDEFWDYLADTHFYIVALKRLLQSMLVAKTMQNVSPELKSSIANFEGLVSDAISMRHILEHIDDYIQNNGTKKEIKNSTLYNSYYENDVLCWADFKFDRRQLHKAANGMVTKYREFCSYEFKLYREKTT